MSIADHTMEFMVGERTRLMEMSRDVTKYFVRVCAANAVGLSTFAYATTSQHVLTKALLRPVAIEGVPLSSTEVRRKALRVACNMRHTIAPYTRSSSNGGWRRSATCKARSLRWACASGRTDNGRSRRSQQCAGRRRPQQLAPRRRPSAAARAAGL